MMLRNIFLPKLEVFLKNVSTAKTRLYNWSAQSKDFIGSRFLIRRLSGKDDKDKEEGRKSQVKEYLKKAPSMQQRSQEQIKELRDLRVELIKERKILQKRLKENEKKIRQEKRRNAPNDNNAIAKYTYKLKMSRAPSKTKKGQAFQKSDGKIMQFHEFIQNFAKSFPDDQSTGAKRNLIETALSKEQTPPPTQQKSPNQGKNIQFDHKSSPKNAVGFAQRILHVGNNNNKAAEASNKTSKDTPNTKSKSNVDPEDAKVYFRGHGKSQDLLKPDQVISTVTKKDAKTEAFEKAKAERNKKLKEKIKGKQETSQLASKLAKKNVLIPIQTTSAQSKENSKGKSLSIPSVSKIPTPIKLNPKGLNTKDIVEKDEPKEKSVSKKSLQKKPLKTVRIPMPIEPYDVLTQARRLKNPKKIKTAKKPISEDPHVNDETPYSQLDLDPKHQFKAYVEEIQQQQTQIQKGVVEPTQASSVDVAKLMMQSRLDLEKCLANAKNSSLKMNSDLAIMKSMPNESIQTGELSKKLNIPPKILEQLKNAKIRNQKFLIKEILDELKQEYEAANNSIYKHSNQNKTETTKKETDRKPILGESGMEVALLKKSAAETCVNDIEQSAKMFLHSLEQFVQCLKANNNNSNDNNKDQNK